MTIVIEENNSEFLLNSIHSDAAEAFLKSLKTSKVLSVSWGRRGGVVCVYMRFSNVKLGPAKK